MLSSAAVETRKLSIDACYAAKRLGLSDKKGKEHGRRFRMAKSLADSMETLRELLWELPGVKWD